MRCALHASLLVLLMGCGARTDLSIDEEGEAGPCMEPPLILVSYVDWPTSDVYAMRADGSDLRRVGLGDEPVQYPTVSRDGRFLAYVPLREDEPNPLVVVLDLQTGELDRVTLGTSISYPTFSPDASLIAYADDLNLRVARRDGSDMRTLIEGPRVIGSGRYGYGHPIFVDDETILWTTAAESGVIDIDGGGRETLLVSDLRGQPFSNPTLSPDGSTLATLNSCDDTFTTELRLYPFDALPADCASGSILVADLVHDARITRSPNPSWGPTDLIAFTQGEDVFVVSAMGGVATNVTAELTSTGGAAGNPVWAPGCTALPRER